MRIKLLAAAAAAAATALSFTTGVYAKTGTGFYTSIKSGVSDINLEDNKASVGWEYLDTTEKYEDIFNFHQEDSDNSEPMVAVALGFDFSTMSNINARAELEYTYKLKSSFSPNVTSVVNEYGSTYYNDDGSINSLGRDFYTYAEDEILGKNINNEMRSHQLMLNGYYDFKNTTKFTPYVSAGVGVTHIKNKISGEAMYWDDNEGDVMLNLNQSDSDTNFTWSVGAGVTYAVTPNVSLDLGYRYVDAGDLKFSSNLPLKDYMTSFTYKSEADLSSHDYTLGIRYTF